jgi:hypothetical protein
VVVEMAKQLALGFRQVERREKDVVARQTVSRAWSLE